MLERRRSPHIRTLAGLLIDMNGVGAWSADGVRKRYQEIASRLGGTAFQITAGTAHGGRRTWISPIMEAVIQRIEEGDPAAVEIGIEFLEEDDFFVFGRILKSNTARALRRAPLTEEQKVRIRSRIVSMLLAGNVPHEFKQYVRLLKAVGVADLWPTIDAGVNRENRYVMRYYDYLNRYARG